MPSTPEPPSHITIKVKVPPGYLSTTDNSSGTDSFVLGSEVPVTSNIGALRQQIQQLIPTHPVPEKQRLLYGGRALVDNEQRLGDAFNVKRDPTQTEYVVHLLVKGEQGASEGAPTPRRAVSTPQAQTPTPTGQTPPQLPFQQGQHGQRIPFAVPGGQLPPHQQHFPQIIARNQQMRAGMGMQGVGGQQLQGQGQPQSNASVEQNAQPNQQQSHTGEQAQQPGNNGQPHLGHHHAHVPGRPISGQGFHMQGVGPNGQRFQIHQQMMQFPLGGGAMPGQLPFGFPAMPQIPGMMPGGGTPQAHLAPGQGLPQQPIGTSALDRARENLAEMRRALDEMRNQNASAEEQQRRIGEIQQRAQSLNDYMDPLHTHAANGAAQGQRGVQPNAPAMSNLPPAFQQGLPPLYNAPRRPTIPIPQAHHRVQPPSNPSEVTAYLLSSPQGPQALLFSPQHGAYTGSFGQNARPQPTPTTTTTAQQPQPGQQGQQQDPVAQAAHRAVQEMQVQHAQLHAAQANQQAQAGQEGGPMQALLGHFWLMMRVLIFAYFFLGSNMGWQRPLALAAIGFVFFLVRAGALGDGAALRRWWEGVVGVEAARPAQGEGAQERQGRGGQQQDGNQQPPAGQGAQPTQRNAMPTPEQVAQRLLNEEANRNQQQNAWWRERIRPVERAVALFVASLWPGVGEATVRARREMEERERAQADAANQDENDAAQDQDAERTGAEAEEVKVGEEGSGGAEVKNGEAASSAVERSEQSEGLRERQAVDSDRLAAGLSD